MKPQRLAVAIAIAIVACAVGAVYFRFWTGPGQGGPESVVPIRYWLAPGQGGPENVVPARYWTGPESITACRWFMGCFSGGSPE